MKDQWASTWTYIGGATAAVGGVTLTEWMAIGGLVVAVAGFVVNVWHKRQMVRIERERLEMDRARG